MEIYRKNAAPQNCGADFVRACAVEMHDNMSQEPLYTEIDRKNTAAQLEHPDQAPAFTPTVRTPQCGHTVWGIMYIYNDVNNCKHIYGYTYLP